MATTAMTAETNPASIHGKRMPNESAAGAIYVCSPAPTTASIAIITAKTMKGLSGPRSMCSRAAALKFTTCFAASCCSRQRIPGRTPATST